MSTGIQIGTDQDSIIYIGEAILAILQEPRDEATIQKALETFQTTAKVENVSISQNSIRMDSYMENE